MTTKTEEPTTNEMEFRDYSVSELRARPEERTVEGYANVFNVVDAYQSMFVRGSFQPSLEERQGRIRFLRGHFPDDVLGVIEELREDEKGLFFRARFSNTQLGNDTLTLVKDGALDEVSIGFRTIKQRFDPDMEVLVKEKVELWEVSLVTFAANSLARVEAVRSVYEHMSQLAQTDETDTGEEEQTGEETTTEAGNEGEAETTTEEAATGEGENSGETTTVTGDENIVTGETESNESLSWRARAELRISQAELDSKIHQLQIH